MKYLDTSALNILIKKLNQYFIKIGEIIIDAPNVINVDVDGVCNLDITTNSYINIIGKINDLNINSINLYNKYSHKENYTYIQFETGSNPIFTVNVDNIVWDEKSEKILHEDTKYRIEINTILNKSFIKIIKYNNEPS